MERTFVMIKPDGVQRSLTGEIIKRLEQRGLKVVAAKFLKVPLELAQKHYAAHEGKSFYQGLVNYIISSPVMALVIEGPNAIAAVRQTMGATDPLNAAPGTVRHDYGVVISRNLTHASDSEESAFQEINLWFSPDEIFSWEQSNEPWISHNN